MPDSPVYFAKLVQRIKNLPGQQAVAPEASESSRPLPAALAMQRPNRPLRWTAGATALLLASLFSAFYLMTRTANYSPDAVRIAVDITSYRADHTLSSLLHPGYLLYGPICYAAWQLAHLIGYPGGVLPVMQDINAVAGGIGIAVLSLLLRAILTRSRALTVLPPIALGLSFGYWLDATDGRAEMTGIAWSILTLYALVRAMLLPTPYRARLAGVAAGIATLMHLFSVLLIPVGIVALCLGEYTQGTESEERRARLINIAVYTSISVAIVLFAYLLVGFSLLGLPATGAAWKEWLSEPFNRDWWISPHPLGNLRSDGYAFRRALFVEPGSKTGTFHLEQAGDRTALMLYWSTLALWFVAAYAILSTTAFLFRTHYRRFLVVFLTVGLLYAIGLSIVSPRTVFYWIPVTAASAVVTGISCAYFRGRRGGIFWLIGLAVWTVVFAASNYVQFIGPHLSMDANTTMQHTLALQKRTKPGDMLVVSGLSDDTSMAAYLPYFGRRTVFSLRDSLDRHEGNPTQAARDLLGAAVREQKSGCKTYALGEIWDDPQVRARLQAAYGVESPQQLFQGLKRAPAWRDTYGDGIVWKLLPITQGAAPTL